MPIVDEWSSLAQFERLIKMEMENLACTATTDAGTLKRTNSSSVSTTAAAAKSNILKPEKHVSDTHLIQ